MSGDDILAVLGHLLENAGLYFAGCIMIAMLVVRLSSRDRE